MHVVFTLSCRDKHIMPIFPPIMLHSYAQFLFYCSFQGAHIMGTLCKPLPSKVESILGLAL